MDLKPGCFGVTIYRTPRTMKEPCANCPFVRAAQGEDYLAPGRLEDIQFAVAMGMPFWCHKTVYSPKTRPETDPETGEETVPDYEHHYMMCKGAVEWAEKLKNDLIKERP